MVVTRRLGHQRFRDDKINFVDNDDQTKELLLQLSGITTATTRTLTIPDASGIIALTAQVDGSILHTALSDMPSSVNTDHDGRYVPYSSLATDVYTFDTAGLTLTGGTLIANRGQFPIDCLFGGTLTVASGTIVDSGPSITFGSNNLDTSGSITANTSFITGATAPIKMFPVIESGSFTNLGVMPVSGDRQITLALFPSGAANLSRLRLADDSDRAATGVVDFQITQGTGVAEIMAHALGAGAAPTIFRINFPTFDVTGNTTLGNNVTVNDDAVAGDGLILKGGGTGGAIRGGVIKLMSSGATTIGYIWGNSDGRVVFDDNVQVNPGDDGRAWIDLNDGSASLAEGNFTVSSTGFVVCKGLDIIGVTQLGDGGTTDYAQFAADGELTLFGTARVLRSVDFEPDAVKKGGVGPGDSTEDDFPIHDYDSTNDESVHIHWEIPHDYASAEEIHLHVEFFVDNAPGAAANVTWGVEYKKLSIGDNFDFSAETTTVIVNDSITTGTPANDKKIHSSAQIQLVTTGFEPMDVVLIRIFRDADASEGGATDNFGSDVRVFNYHLMYLSDKLGEAA